MTDDNTRELVDQAYEELEHRLDYIEYRLGIGPYADPDDTHYEARRDRIIPSPEERQYAKQYWKQKLIDMKLTLGLRDD